MRRREFITLLGGAAVAWPLAAHAQQSAMPVLGLFSSASPDAFKHYVTAFHRGLNEAGYVEGKNVTIEYRWAEGHYDRLPALVTDLMRKPVALLAVSGGAPGIQAAKEATTTLPIVFLGGGDPVELGFVASINRPGGNITGVNQLTNGLGPKRLGLLRELVPAAGTIHMLLNPVYPLTPAFLKEIEEAARALGQPLEIVHAASEGEIDAAFEAMARAQPSAPWQRRSQAHRARSESCSAASLRTRPRTTGTHSRRWT